MVHPFSDLKACLITYALIFVPDFLNYPDDCFILVKNIAEPTNSDYRMETDHVMQRSCYPSCNKKEAAKNGHGTNRRQ